MGDTIRDPSTQKGMGVNSDGRGLVQARIHDDALDENIEHGRAFILDLPAVVLGSNWVWAVIKNNNDLDLVIAKAVLWTASNKDNDIIGAYTRGAFAYSANGTVATAAQLNAGKALPGTNDLTLYYNDAVGDLATITAGQTAGKILARTTPQTLEVRGRWIIPKDQVFYLKSELANDNTYTGYIEMYYHV